MRTLIRAMTEEQHDKRTWRGNALIGTFITLNLLLSFSLRKQSEAGRDAIALHNDNSSNEPWDADRAHFIFTSLVAAAQFVVTVTVLTGDSPLLKGCLPDKEALSIIGLAHAGSIFLRDFLTEQNVLRKEDIVVQDIAFFSPVLALLALWLVTSLPGKPITWFSLISVGFGCSMLCTRVGAVPTSPSSLAASDRAALVCGLSLFAAALRNIALKQLVHEEGLEIKTRVMPEPYTHVQTWAVAAGAAAATVFGVFLMGPPGWGVALLFASLTCALSAALFVFTAHVLRVFGVASAALFGAWALLIEALLLTPVALRPNLLTCVLAIVLLAIGHLLYLRVMPEPDASLTSPGAEALPGSHRKGAIGLHEQYTRLEFLLFATAVVGVVFYVFQPRVSQRDLDTLSYVGLDKVIRRLLSVAPTPEATIASPEN